MDTRHARQYRLLLQDLSAKYGAETTDQREAIYVRARRSNEKLIETHRERLTDSIIDDMRTALEEVIVEFETAAAAPAGEALEEETAESADRPDYEPAQPAADEPREPSRRIPDTGGLASSNFALGAAAGVAATALLLLLCALVGLVSFGSGGPYAAEFERLSEETRPAFETTLAFTQRVETALKERLAADPAGLEKAVGEKFVQLGEALPELAEAAKALPMGARVVLRANGEGYKVLTLTPACVYARFVAPQFIDAKRDRGGLGCTYLAVYNDGGKDY